MPYNRGMGDNAELHSEILRFLMGEWVRKENRQLVGVDLLYAPGGGFGEDEIRRWEREDEAELFAEIANVEYLVTQIIEIAQNECDAKTAGRHRFVVRTRQHFGSKPKMSFVLYPSWRGSGDDVALVPNGAGGGGGKSSDTVAMQILAQNNGQFMRINAQMFDAALRPLAQQNSQLLDEIISLRRENSDLNRKLAEAEANKNDREFQIAMQMEKNARANAGFQKLLQIGTVVAAKIGAGTGDQAQIGGGGGAPLAMLIAELKQSLRPDQMGVIMQTLDMGQKMLFLEIVNQAGPPDQGQGPKPPGPNGMPSS